MIAAWFQWIGGGSGVLAIILLLIQRIGDRRTVRANAIKAEAEAALARANTDKAEEEAREIALRSQIEADKHMAVLRQGHYDAWLAVKAIREEAAANLEAQRLTYERQLSEERARTQQALTDKRIVEDQLTRVQIDQYEVDTARRQNAETRALRIEVQQLRDEVQLLRTELELAQTLLKQAAQNTEGRIND